MVWPYSTREGGMIVEKCTALVNMRKKKKKKTYMQAENIAEVRDSEGGNWDKLLRKLETANR